MKITDMIQEDEKLKQFMLDNFDFDGMKEIGFWPKGTKRNDYVAQAKRVCHYFGFKSIYEYIMPEIEDVGSNTLIVKGADSINPKGEYVSGFTGIMNVIKGDFNCPICTCPQTMKPAKTNGIPHKCTGCKRKLHVIVPLFDSTKGIEVTEWD